ncbi:hypothetical protein [Empedobacter falsenii]|uniref:Chemotaxis methyl-accepting receptor HlyB-like 4HB MCP domain-containing protein n=1 Tax=Empedobacter falsenii TaxID=343874 RepID=A0AAW7DFD0_9FLAO|nr:hypothetical protein [Empedobacter falsenii]MDM1550676.1 hypothetical protein [Empedobacter falsenii]
MNIHFRNITDILNKNIITILIPSLLSLLNFIYDKREQSKENIKSYIESTQRPLKEDLKQGDIFIKEISNRKKYSDLNTIIFNDISNTKKSNDYNANIKILKTAIAKHNAYKYYITEEEKIVFNSVENILNNYIKINELKLKSSNVDSIKFYEEKIMFESVTLTQAINDTLTLVDTYYKTENFNKNEIVNFINKKKSYISYYAYLMTFIVIIELILIFLFFKKGYYKN